MRRETKISELIGKTLTKIDVIEKKRIDFYEHGKGE